MLQKCGPQHIHCHSGLFNGQRLELLLLLEGQAHLLRDPLDDVLVRGRVACEEVGVDITFWLKENMSLSAVTLFLSFVFCSKILDKSKLTPMPVVVVALAADF